MDKQQVLSELKQLAASGQISREEIMAAIAGQGAESDVVKHNLSLSEILYYIGGGIVFLGICVLAYQNWDNFSSVVRVLLTLGSGIAAFVVGGLLYRYENLKKISQAFFLIAGCLAPLGVNVAFKEAGMDISADSLQVLIYLILTGVFFGSLWFFRQTILLFFGIIFATGLFHFLVNMVVGQNLLSTDTGKIWEYRFLVEGFSWVLIGYYLKPTSFKALTGTLFGFGILTFLGSAMALGGWSPEQNAFWELIFPLLVFGVIFLSVYVKSKSFLVFGSLFLIGYILKLTAEYFSSGLGWPLALVLAGLAIMGVGYYAVKLNKKYFAAKV
ncbi:MAG: hypothetical protein HY918_00645 [Candidatus Doudnabacteria bacterium]|nr:hypothetical protein [Candidatus Doudnabacteria bacterium]